MAHQVVARLEVLSGDVFDLIVLYRSIFDVVRDFMLDNALQGQDRTLTKYLKPDLLIVDNMGMKNLPRRAGEILFEIIMRRYETRSTMMTSNRPIDDWGKLIGDVPSATAILDRFLHHAEVIAITGRSYRLRNQSRGPDLPTTNDTEESKPAIPPTGSLPAAKRKKQATEANEASGWWRLSMANVLKMAKIQSIQQLHAAGWSVRRIARELEIDRGTVARYVWPRPRLAIGTQADPPTNRR